MLNTVRIKLAQPLVYILPLVFLLTACPRKPIEEVRCDLPSVGYVSANQLDKLDISINIDGSGSMIGYVSVNNNNYTEALDAIENVVDQNQTTTVEYKRIGDDKLISRNDFRRDAKSMFFYDGSNPQQYKKVSSPIQEAIKPPSQGKDKLTIIVTDLEGDDGDLISERLKQYYFNPQIKEQGYTVGVWAIKTQFQGNVYDPNTGKTKFYYSTEGKTQEDYRPFYVLFIGKYNHIANYFDQIKNLHSQLVSDSEMFIFPASNIVKEAISLGALKTRENKVELPDNNQLERVYSLEDENVIVVTENDDIPYELFQVIHEEEKIISLDYQVAFPLLTDKDKGGSYSLAVDENNLRLKTRVFTFGKATADSNNIQPAQTQPNNAEGQDNNEESIIKQPKKESQAKQFFQQNSNLSLQNGLTIEDLTLAKDNQTLDFVTKINLDNLSNSQIYLFEVDLILDNMQDLDWWENWDSKNANSKDGSKTENISLFMNKLEKLSLDSIRDQDNNAVIGRLCFAIQKN